MARMSAAFERGAARGWGLEERESARDQGGVLCYRSAAKANIGEVRPMKLGAALEGRCTDVELDRRHFY